MKKTVTVSIVDDDCELTAKISAYLNKTSSYRCISSYASAEEALAQLAKDSPDVVLMDINLGGMNGIECVRQLRPSLPNTPVVMLTVFEDTDKIFRAIAAGASGYLLKRMPPSKLLDAIAEVVGGGSPMSAPIARKVIQLLQSMPVPSDDTVDLSDRERQVLEAMAAGQLYKQIADDLCVSIHTVRSYIRRIYEKLHVRTRTEAVAKYFRH
ncbi:MAG TPA: response regulator transcription factor [Verrucomicrobiae bacterium]|jgi:DNA-binding NarL/FixJ family response regulator|nr:response regulator transcription factor [Verrucomicrobiae bacterium]